MPSGTKVRWSRSTSPGSRRRDVGAPFFCPCRISTTRLASRSGGSDTPRRGLGDLSSSCTLEQQMEVEGRGLRRAAADSGVAVLTQRASCWPVEREGSGGSPGSGGGGGQSRLCWCRWHATTSAFPPPLPCKTLGRTHQARTDTDGRGSTRRGWTHQELAGGRDGRCTNAVELRAQTSREVKRLDTSASRGSALQKRPLLTFFSSQAKGRTVAPGS